MTAIEAGVDVHDDHVRGTTVEHAQQRGQAVKMGAVADARRHGDHRAIDQPADHAGQGAFHAGDDDQQRRHHPGGEADAAAGASPATPTSATSETSQFQASAVTRASSATGRSLVPAVTMTTRPTLGAAGAGPGIRNVRPSSLCSPAGNDRLQMGRGRGIDPGHQPPLLVLEQGPQDGLDLRGRLALAEDHLGKTAADDGGAGRPWRIRRHRRKARCGSAARRRPRKARRMRPHRAVA